MSDNTAEILLAEFREFRREIQEWKQEATERITALEVHDRDISGNGQPGRMRDVERRVSRHSRIIWIGSGVLLACEAIIGAAIKLWPGK